MYGFKGYATGPKYLRASRLAGAAALSVALFGIGHAQASVQYSFVPTSIDLRGERLAPLQVFNVEFSATDAAFQAGRVSADVTCFNSLACSGSNNGLANPRFYRNTIDVTLRPDGLVDGSYRSTRDTEEYALSGTGLLWSGRFFSDFPYQIALTNEHVFCGGSLLSGGGCTITGYFLTAAQTTPGQGTQVPEPASAALLAGGLLTLLRRRR